LALLQNDLNANSYSILNIKRLVGRNGMWEVDEDGRFITRLETSDGQKSLYSIQSAETEYVFSGSAKLQGGVARVDFDVVTREIIDPEKPMKINITLTSEALGVYMSGKDGSGFVVKEVQGGKSDATFDYVVIATRKGKVEPMAQPEVEVPVPQVEQPPADNSEPDQNAPAEEEPAQNPPADQPAQVDPQEAPAQEEAPPSQDPPAEQPLVQPELQPQVEAPVNPPADSSPPPAEG